MTESIGLPIASAEAVDWVRDSLAEGSALALLMRDRVGSSWSAHLIVPGTRVDPWTQPLSPRGLGYRTPDVDLLASQFLESLARSHVQTLVVEDDVARRGDRNLTTVAYVEDRVLRWMELGPDPVGAAALLRRSAYPLNAFVCCRSATQLKLEPGYQMGPEDQEAIVESTEAVIVSVYDAEAYVALLSPA
jgi:hypothetical protein